MTATKVIQMTQTAILIAIIILMAFTPIGYLRTAGLEISLITIPVVIGAMLLGPKAGFILGGIFGITSFYQCFGMSPFGSMLLGINPIYTFLVCVPTRMLMGGLTGLIFKGIKKINPIKVYSWFIGGAVGAFLNTLIFMVALVLLFWNTEYIQGINETFGELGPVLFIVVFVGVNGLLEIPATCLIGGGISKVLHKVFKME